MLADLLPVAATATWLAVLAASPLALRAVVRQAAALTPGEQRLCLALALLALAIRLAVPGAMVEIFTGYALIGDAILGAPPPKYGAGQAALLRPWFALTAPGEPAVFLLHGLQGWLSTVLAAALVGGRLGGRGTTAAVLAVLAVLPLLVRHHRSEAATVEAMFAFLVGWLAWREAAVAGRVALRLLAALALAAAAHVRPEFLVAVPLALWADRRWPEPRQGPVLPLWPALAVWGLAVAPQVVHVALAAVRNVSAGDLPAVGPWLAVRLPVGLVTHQLALWPHAFPIVLTVAGIVAILRAKPTARTPDGRLLRWGGVVALGTLAPALVDPVVVSLPRLEAPALLLWAALAAAIVWRRWGLADTPVAVADPPLRRRGVAAAAGLALAASMAATVPWLWAPDNADEEAAFFARAAQVLAGRTGTLHLLLPDDAGSDKVSRHVPFWLFGRPRASLRLRPLRDLPPEGTALDEPRYVLLGLRCLARHRPHDTPPPAAFQHEACRMVRQRQDLQPLLEARVPNHGDVSFPWWPATMDLPVGLYVVRAAAVPAGAGR